MSERQRIRLPMPSTLPIPTRSHCHHQLDHKEQHKGHLHHQTMTQRLVLGRFGLWERTFRPAVGVAVSAKARRQSDDGGDKEAHVQLFRRDAGPVDAIPGKWMTKAGVKGQWGRK